MAIDFDKVLKFAHENGSCVNHCEKIASTKEGDFYSLSLLDENGFSLPIGLPVIVKIYKNEMTLIQGEDALNLRS